MDNGLGEFVAHALGERLVLFDGGLHIKGKNSIGIPVVVVVVLGDELAYVGFTSSCEAEEDY